MYVQKKLLNCVTRVFFYQSKRIHIQEKYVLFISLLDSMFSTEKHIFSRSFFMIRESTKEVTRVARLSKNGEKKDTLVN